MPDTPKYVIISEGCTYHVCEFWGAEKMIAARSLGSFLQMRIAEEYRDMLNAKDAQRNQPEAT